MPSFLFTFVLGAVIPWAKMENHIQATFIYKWRCWGGYIVIKYLFEPNGSTRYFITLRIARGAIQKPKEKVKRQAA